jgi:hypothetical protein
LRDAIVSAPWTLILKPPRSSAVSNCPTTELIGLPNRPP